MDINYDEYRAYRARLPLIQDSRLRIQATHLLEFIAHTESALAIARNILGPNQGGELSILYCLSLQKGEDGMEALAQDARNKLNKILDQEKPSQ